jgi:hepatocellular carcinoma-associated antigen 59
MCVLLKQEQFSSEPEDKAAKMRRAVRANNFTQQTNALDVDKHMYVPATHNVSILSKKLRYPVSCRMAYIEENMKLRRGHQEQSSSTPEADMGTSMGKETTTSTTTTNNTTAGAKSDVNNAKDDDDPFDHLDPRYKVERKLGEEGSVTNSLAMLTAIPEVDLGIKYVLNTTTTTTTLFSPPSLHLILIHNALVAHD